MIMREIVKWKSCRGSRRHLYSICSRQDDRTMNHFSISEGYDEESVANKFYKNQIHDQ